MRLSSSAGEADRRVSASLASRSSQLSELQARERPGLKESWLDPVL